VRVKFRRKERMKKTSSKITVVFVWTLLMLNIFGVAFVQVGSAAYIPDYEPIDIGPQLRENDFGINMISLPDDYGTGNPTKVWLYLDDYTGYYYFDMFELRAVGTIAEIWVQVDLSWPEEDPRPYPIITDEQVAYLLEEFETNIYPTDTSYFGAPDIHDGINSLLVEWGYFPPGYYYEETGRNVILVSNIRDENYYDYTYPYYIAGFYSSSFEGYFDRNIISIDSYNWEDRVGPDVRRPYLYESVIAHEYQHLIHADYNPGDPSFMNEGCSMFAEILCGYPIPWGDINSYLYTPDNSLTEWGDQGGINILADYGAAALWAIYLKDQFGPTFLSDFVQAGIPGIEGINAALKKGHHWIKPGKPMTFDYVYHNWRIANLIHTDDPGEGKYNYETIDLGSPEAIPARTYDIKTPLVSPRTGTSFGSTITILGYNTGVYKLGSYGSDYIKFKSLKEKSAPTLKFNGDDIAGVSWIREDMDGDGDLEWYSTSAGNLADLSIIAEVDLSGMATAILTFDTYFDIEPYWDFGFTQVSTDGGATWTSLMGTYTTYDHDFDAHPDIVANLPGCTGFSGAWLPEEMNLTPYVGGVIMLRFRYMTDWGVLYPGWWVDNIAVTGTIIDNADDIVIFEPSPPLPEVDFMVTIIGAVDVSGMPTYTLIEDMTLNDMTESGTIALAPFIGKKGYVLLIISPNQGPADYVFSVTKG